MVIRPLEAFLKRAIRIRASLAEWNERKEGRKEGRMDDGRATKQGRGERKSLETREMEEPVPIN